MYPSYLNFSKKEFDQRIKKLFQVLEKCEICPRRCGVNRLKGERGFCKLGVLPMVSSFHPHFGEETVLVGKYGSGTIFFTYCNLACVYCQNYDISQLGAGKEITYEELADIMLKLQEMGCHNINLVTPTPQLPQIIKALKRAIEKKLKIPLVYNTNAYDSIEVLKLLDGIIDIYMPDVKYSNEKMALKYSFTPKYSQIMKRALKEMHRQVGDLIVNEKGIATKGLLVRHLVLPNNIAGSKEIFEFIAKEISKNTFLNIMNQYYPAFKAKNFSELSFFLSSEEYFQVVKLAKNIGLKKLYNFFSF